MRIIIYGAGGIGSATGGILSQHGQDVVLIGRKGHVDAINKNGLKLTTPQDTYTVKIQAVTSPDQIEFRNDDVVFLTMKSQSTSDAVKDLHKYVSDVPVFCFQNGVRNEEIVSQYFSDVYGAALRFATQYITDGEVECRRDPPGWLIIGRYPNGTDQVCENVAEILRSAGFMVAVSPDVMPYKWGKLMNNLINAIHAITDSRDPGTITILDAAREEAYKVAKEAGIVWKADDEVFKDFPEHQALAGTRKWKGLTSTWQSLMRDSGTVETDFINGEFVRLAKKLGQNAPVNEKLQEIVIDMADKCEKPGKFTSEQLISLLELK